MRSIVCVVALFGLSFGQTFNSLGFHVLQQLSADENAVFSPSALGRSLVALLEASGGDTRRQLMAALNSEEKTEILRKEFAKHEMALKVANLLLSARPFKAAFVEAAASVGVAAERVNFTHTRAAKQRINDLIRTATGSAHHVRDALSADSDVVLVQSVRMEPELRIESMKEKRVFRNHVSPALPPMEVRVPFVAADGLWRRRTDEGLRAEVLAMAAKSATMDVFLILCNESMDWMNENATESDVTRALDATLGVEAKETRVLLPQLKLESEWDLLEVLDDLQVTSLAEGGADLQRAFDDVTKAAKVTSAVQKTALEWPAPTGEAADTKADVVAVDGPFWTVVRDRESGAWEAVGRVTSLQDESLLSQQFF